MNQLSPSARRTLAHVARLLRDGYAGDIELLGCQQGGVREIRLHERLLPSDLPADDGLDVEEGLAVG